MSDQPWLNAPERAPLERHLAECPSCRQEFRQAWAVGELFAQVRAEAPAGFADGVMAALDRSAQTDMAGRRAVVVLSAALAAEIAVRMAGRVSVAGLGQKVAAIGAALWEQWVESVMVGGWGAIAGGWTKTTFGTALLNPRWWGSAVLVAVLFAWFAFQQRRTDRA
jgi:anti-sigma factor RsiW